MTKKKEQDHIIRRFFQEESDERPSIFAADRESATAFPEVDFQPVTPALPNLPAGQKAGQEETKAYWRNLRLFFRSGKGGGLPLFKDRPIVAPALLGPYLTQGFSPEAFPFWVDEVSGDGKPLKTLIDNALGSNSSSNGSTGILVDNRSRLEALLAKELDKAAGIGAWPELLREAAVRLQRQLDLPRLEQEALGKELQQLERALPAAGRVYAYSEHLPLRLLEAAIRSNRHELLTEFREEVRLLSNRLQDLLTVERQKAPSQEDREKLRSTYDFADTFINFDQLSTIEPPAGSAPMPAERHHRLEELLHTLETAAETLFERTATVIVAHSWPEESLPSFEGATVRRAPEGGLCREARETFRGQIAAATKIFAARRIAELELREQYEQEVHGDFFAHFDWRSLTEEELAICPALIVLSDDSYLLEKELNEFSQLLSTYKPVKFLVYKRQWRPYPAETLTAQREMAALAVAHRQAFVLQSTSVTPGDLFDGMRQGLEVQLPALFYVLYTEDRPLWASAAIEGRAFPGFRYNPLASDHWGSRFYIGNNPQPENNWPDHTMKLQNAAGEEIELPLPFTFADFAAQDPTWAPYFQIVPERYWTEHLVPLDPYLYLPPEEAYTKVPFIWMVDDQQLLMRVAVAWPLVLACRERLDFWDFLQENAGFNSSHVEQALERQREELELARSQALEELKKQHLQEVEEARRTAAGEAMDNLAAVLLELDSLPAARPATAVEAVAPKTKEPAEESAATEAEEPAEKVEAAPEEPALPLGEAWIETVLCTSCNECIDLNKQIFRYNADKQAYVADPKGGPFADIVQAAESCPAGIIHPGAPQDPNEPGLEELINRAKAYN